MDSTRIHTNKYSKVNQQRKFHLLSLIYKQKTAIKEAAKIVGINYLTAKTIVFFHKNNYKSYQFDLTNPTHTANNQQQLPTASFAPYRKINSTNQKLIKPKSRIEVICSIGNVLSPCSKPVNYPEGQITGQFASKSDGMLEAYRNIQIPEIQNKGHEWMLMTPTVERFPFEKINLTQNFFGEAMPNNEFRSLKVREQ